MGQIYHVPVKSYKKFKPGTQSNRFQGRGTDKEVLWRSLINRCSISLRETLSRGDWFNLLKGGKEPRRQQRLIIYLWNFCWNAKACAGSLNFAMAFRCWGSICKLCRDKKPKYIFSIHLQVPFKLILHQTRWNFVIFLFSDTLIRVRVMERDFWDCRQGPSWKRWSWCIKELY